MFIYSFMVFFSIDLRGLVKIVVDAIKRNKIYIYNIPFLKLVNY